jgi:hypothetical protein
MDCRLLVNTMWVWGRRYMRVGACIGLIVSIIPSAIPVSGLACARRLPAHLSGSLPVRALPVVRFELLAERHRHYKRAFSSNPLPALDSRSEVCLRFGPDESGAAHGGSRFAAGLARCCNPLAGHSPFTSLCVPRSDSSDPGVGVVLGIRQDDTCGTGGDGPTSHSALAAKPQLLPGDGLPPSGLGTGSGSREEGECDRRR